jgi:four helix bundle protein
MSDMDNLKLFQKTYDYYEWIYPHLKNYPKSERFTMVQHIENTLLDLISSIVMARKSSKTLKHLEDADRHLEKLKVYLRLSKDLEFISIGQYKESSEKLTEIGKILGGWIKAQ